MKVAVIGLDSADWDLLDRWLSHLPNLAEIRREGVSGRLESCIPPVTIPAWKCYSTGKNPGKLGVYWFAYPDFRHRRLEVSFPGHLGGNLWDYIPKALVVNTPGTFPPRRIDGIMISGFPCPDGQPFTSPAWVQPQLAGYRVSSRLDPLEPDFPGEAMELMKSRFEVFHRYAPQFNFGQVTVFYIDELHHLYGSDPLVLDAWRLIDEEIGRILDMADNVVIVSDHGSGPLRNYVNVVPRLMEIGALRLRRGSLRRLSQSLGKSVGRVPFDFAGISKLLPPKLRDAAIDRVGPMEDWISSSAEQFRHRVDWSSSVLPLSQGLVYGNPGRPRRPVPLTAVSQALEELPGVLRVWRREEIYRGPHVSSAPELWIEAEPGVEVVARFDDQWETKSPNRERGWIFNHRQHGIFGFLGKDVVQSELTEASLYDMCPTILSFFGLPPPASIDGAVLQIASAGQGRRGA